MENNTYSYQNERIEEENFVFDDKGGKFFMYADYLMPLCELHGGKYEIKIWSENDADEKCVSMKVELDIINDKCFPQSSNGKKAYLKLDYNKVHADDLYHILVKLIKVIPANYAFNAEKLKGKDSIYVILLNTGKFYYTTKEDFETPIVPYNFEPCLNKRLAELI